LNVGCFPPWRDWTFIFSSFNPEPGTSLRRKNTRKNKNCFTLVLAFLVVINLVPAVTAATDRPNVALMLADNTWVFRHYQRIVGESKKSLEKYANPPGVSLTNTVR
jgi:hypothetical protein